ncbi:unnamed protein product [Brassica rapa]|uniref:Uncharacterized protein n=1 Tax=Brassica campestris TaxID=3711 RepID=A0A3P5YFY2_BRACM|nr:unnamed protein product [Brassica rapa]VDC66642.1 unnamed protein product [Brassica rapa]
MVEFNVINGCITSIVLDLLPENLPLRRCSILSDCNLLRRMVDSLNKAIGYQETQYPGKIASIEFEYEKIHKRCFHGLHLTHEKI